MGDERKYLTEPEHLVGKTIAALYGHGVVDWESLWIRMSDGTIACLVPESGYDGDRFVVIEQNPLPSPEILEGLGIISKEERSRREQIEREERDRRNAERMRQNELAQLARLKAKYGDGA